MWVWGVSMWVSGVNSHILSSPVDSKGHSTFLSIPTVQWLGHEVGIH